MPNGYHTTTLPRSIISTYIKIRNLSISHPDSPLNQGPPSTVGYGFLKNLELVGGRIINLISSSQLEAFEVDFVAANMTEYCH